MTAPVHHDFDIYQGENFSFVYTYKDSSGAAVNLTGYTARMSVKRDLRADNSVYLSTGADADGGTIALGGSAGTVTLSMTDNQTDAMDETDWFFRMMDGQPDLPIDPKVEFYYDLEIESGAGVVKRLLQGKITFWRSVTKVT